MPPSSLASIILKDDSPSSFLASEKSIAVKELTEDSVFAPAGRTSPGPYILTLSIADGRLVLEIADADGALLPALVLSLKPYSRLIRDYFMLIESYEEIRRFGQAEKLEAIDMGRRSVHNEGADMLIERLAGKIELDHPTARRLFTLICALHHQHAPVF